MKIGFIIVLCISLTSIMKMYAQTSTTFSGTGGNVNVTGAQISQSLYSILPHSPEAESVEKFGILPVNLYTGIPQINVPIAEIKTPSLNVPFSLAYNYNGYKPTEMASYVGLGWGLQGYGAIVKIVKDKLDNSGVNNYDQYINYTPFFNWQSFLFNVNNGHYDTKPDIYLFNVGGYSGKFILIKGKAFLFPYQNIKIEQVSSDAGEGAFKLTDDHGNEYLFDVTETTIGHKNAAGEAFTPTHVSTWFLSSITSADKKDEITYEYESYKFRQPLTYLETYDGQISVTNVQSDAVMSKYLVSVRSNYGQKINFQLSTDDRKDLTGIGVHAKRIDEITVYGIGSSDTRVCKRMKFSHGYFDTNRRLKLKGIAIAEIVCNNLDGALPSFPTTDIRTYSFEYFNEATTSFPQNDTKGIDFWGYYNGEYNQTLFTKGIIDNYTFGKRNPNLSFCRYGMMNKVIYPTGGYTLFEYEQNKRGSFVVHNTHSTTETKIESLQYVSGSGNATEGSKSFQIYKKQKVEINYIVNAEGVPNYQLPVVSIYQGVVSKSRKVFSSQLLTLTKDKGTEYVVLDTGKYILVVSAENCVIDATGSVKYEDYSVLNTLEDGPGLRIKKLTSFDNVRDNSTPSLLRFYGYNGGVGGKSIVWFSKKLHAQCEDATFETLYTSSNGALSDFDENTFMYSEVSVLESVAGVTGKTVYKFAKSSGFGGKVNCTAQADYKVVGFDLVPIKEINYQYVSEPLITFMGFDVDKTQVFSSNSGAGCLLLTDPNDPSINNLLHLFQVTSTEFYESEYTHLVQTKEKIYDEDGANFLENVVDYQYNNPNVLLPTKVLSKNSSNEGLNINYKNPFDFMPTTCTSPLAVDINFETAIRGLLANGSCSSSSCESAYKDSMATIVNNRNSGIDGFSACLANQRNLTTTDNPTKAVLWMLEKNIVTPVIEQQSTLLKADGNTYVKSASKTDYQIINGAVMPIKTYATEIAAPVLLSSFTNNPGNYYAPQVSFEYDANLNIITQKPTNGISQSFIWGYNNLYPIATITNAEADAVAATSFEHDAKGNWTYDHTKGTINNDGVTGSAAYQLDQTLSNSITKTGLDATRKYVITNWSKTDPAQITGSYSAKNIATKKVAGVDWYLYSHSITGVNTVVITPPTASITIDELRLYPLGAQMATYTYQPSFGKTSECDVNNRVSSYEYNSRGKLKLVRGDDGNILKYHETEYQQNP